MADVLQDPGPVASRGPWSLVETGRATTWWTPALALVAAGWGANQFAPLIVMYRTGLDLSTAELQVMYGVYALGLVPSLLVGGWLSDRVGRRAVTLPGVLVAGLATMVLMGASGGTGLLLHLGRLVAGVGCGLVFATATAWVAQLCPVGPVGPRRATLAVTAGFALGPLVAGLTGQWAPTPMVTAYLPHAVLTVAAAAVLLRTPSDRIRRPGDHTNRTDWAAVRRVLPFLVLFAPWVFATAAVFLAYLVPLVAPSTGSLALAFSAVAAGVGAGAGMLAQPLGGRLAGRGGRALVHGALALAAAGFGIGAAAAYAGSPALVLVASIALGLAYGTCQFAGLLQVRRRADAGSLGVLTGVYQTLSYTGFAVPVLLTTAGSRWSVPPEALLLGLVVLVVVAAGGLLRFRVE